MNPKHHLPLSSNGTRDAERPEAGETTFLIEFTRPRPELHAGDHVRIIRRARDDGFEPATAAWTLHSGLHIAPGCAAVLARAGGLAALPPIRVEIRVVRSPTVGPVLGREVARIDVFVRPGGATVVLHQRRQRDRGLEPAMSGRSLQSRLDPGPALAARFAPAGISAYECRAGREVVIVAAGHIKSIDRAGRQRQQRECGGKQIDAHGVPRFVWSLVDDSAIAPRLFADPAEGRLGGEMGHRYENTCRFAT